MLSLTLAQEKDGGLYVRPSKTKNKIGEARLFAWTEDLKNVIRRIMDKALSETKLRERFQERDLRAKTATDADMQGKDATDLLGHGDRRTTQIYIRHKKAKIVQPLSLLTNENNESKSNEK